MGGPAPRKRLARARAKNVPIHVQNSEFMVVHRNTFHVPAEILSLICSFYAATSFPLAQASRKCEPCFNKDLLEGYYNCLPVFDDALRQREQVLNTLSGTCHSLRVNSLPLLYESINILPRIHGGTTRYKSFDRIEEEPYVTELREKLEIVTIREPYLANYVRCVWIFCLSSFSSGYFRVRTCAVVLTSFKASQVFKELARALQLLPNLEVLEILGVLEKNAPVLAGAFKKVKLATVTKASLCSAASSIIHSIPNVKDLYLNWQQPIPSSGLLALNSLHELKQLVVLDGWPFDHALPTWEKKMKLSYFNSGFKFLQSMLIPALNTNEIMDIIPILPQHLRKLVANMQTRYVGWDDDVNDAQVISAFGQRVQGVGANVPVLVCSWETLRFIGTDETSDPLIVHWRVFQMGTEWIGTDVTCEDVRLCDTDRCCGYSSEESLKARTNFHNFHSR
ncbi:hypothetical protein DL96DRAFT_1623654 [Flagelloscypha sp. PMI_526]|nr:hypothetical protein DL96DRAFT_1623654 [Flagelloscypha sp. PMI_526]